MTLKLSPTFKLALIWAGAVGESGLDQMTSRGPFYLKLFYDSTVFHICY